MRSAPTAEKLDLADDCDDPGVCDQEANSGRVNGAKVWGSHWGCGCSAKGGGMPRRTGLHGSPAGRADESGRKTVFTKVRGGTEDVADTRGSACVRGSKVPRLMGGSTLEKWGEVSTCVAWAWGDGAKACVPE